MSNFRTELLNAFPDSFINHKDEFIAHRYSNQYIILSNCQSREDVECKVIEWFSRPAHKTAPYRTEWRNKAFHKLMLTGVNEFLGTKFTEEDMNKIYAPLGNAINHEKTLEFVRSGYDISVLLKGVNHE